MKLSVIFSIFNRSLLFSRALKTVITQTMPKEDFELVVIDDMSTEDIKSVLAPYKGKLNIRYIQYDHRLHPIWAELNPTGVELNWRHTQAISANIGIGQATGDILCIAQPEMLHSPYSFEMGYARACEARQVYSEFYWGSAAFNTWLEGSEWENMEFGDLLAKAESLGWEYTHPESFWLNSNAWYWYTLYFPKAHAIGINGVDLAYQAGVYAEDCQFQSRLRMAQCAETWGGRPEARGPIERYCVAIHQSHLDEGTLYKKQDRQSQAWNEAAERNRTLWRLWLENPYVVANSNLPYDVWGSFLITENTYDGLY